MCADCPPVLKELLLQKRYLEAIKTWNEHFADPVVGVHRIEIIKKGCHHDELVDPDDENYFLVQLDYEDGSADCSLLACLQDTLVFVTSYMVPVLPGGRTDSKTRREAWKLVIEDRRAEAIDTWNQGQSDPTFTIYKIQIIKANCHATVEPLGGDSEPRED